MLQCEVNGDKPINVVWLRGGKYELNPSTNYRVSIKQDATIEGISAEVQITNVESSDSGQYFCQASNLYGRDQQLVQLQVQEPPQPPSSLETTVVSSRSVSLKWQPRGGDAAEVTKYIVEYRENDRQWQYMEISDPPQYTAVIESLKPATKYSFRVIAEGPAGKSAPSQGKNEMIQEKFDHQIFSNHQSLSSKRSLKDQQAHLWIFRHDQSPQLRFSSTGFHLCTNFAMGKSRATTSATKSRRRNRTLTTSLRLLVMVKTEAAKWFWLDSRNTRDTQSLLKRSIK